MATSTSSMWNTMEQLNESVADLTWQQEKMNDFDNLDVGFDYNFAYGEDTGAATSSITSTPSSGSDCLLSSSSLRSLPAWSITASSKPGAGQNLSSPAFHEVSPGDANSPSGLSNGPIDHGLADDAFVIPDPESKAISQPRIQRKKRTHFANIAQHTRLPSSTRGFGEDGEDDVFSAGASHSSIALKSFKSVPNLNGDGGFARRVSSHGYTARLEDLLAEMGWTNDTQSQGLDGSELDLLASDASNEGDTTLRGYQAAMDAADASGFTQAGSSGTLSSQHSAGSLASGMPLHTTNSALYQRRAESREGLMPTPAPVAVISKATLEGGDALKKKEKIEDESAEDLNLVSQSSSQNALSSLAVNQTTATHQRAMDLAAQTQRLQQMAAQMINVGSSSSHSGDESAESGRSSLRHHRIGSSGGLDSGKSITVGLVDSPASASNGLLLASPAPNLTTGRPGTAGSGSTMTELHTPLTPFVNMNLTATPSNNGNAALAQGSEETGSWQQPSYNFIFGSPMVADPAAKSTTMNEIGLIQLNRMRSHTTATENNQLGLLGARKQGTTHPLNEEYLGTLQNSLGLYNAPSVAAPAAIVNPSALLHSSAFSPMFGSGVNGAMANTNAAAHMQTPHTAFPLTQSNHHQKLIFPPQQQKVVPVGTSALSGQRPRAGTAMAALGTAGGPRHMKSTPNLSVSPTSMLDSPLYDHTVSLTSTPVKGLRKIASNRRLNGVHGIDSPSMHGTLTLPSSPISPTKRRAGGGMGALASSKSMGSLAAASSGSATFEFINYGINDADELCSAVAPSGSYKIPLKGFGEDAEDDDDDYDEGMGGAGGDFGVDNDDDDAPSSARPARRKGAGTRKSRTSINRSGPRWRDADAPPVPSLKSSSGASVDDDLSVGDSEGTTTMHSPSNDAAAMTPLSPRSIKRRKSDASMMLAGRRKSPSMSNLRRS